MSFANIVSYSAFDMLVTEKGDDLSISSSRQARFI